MRRSLVVGRSELSVDDVAWEEVREGRMESSRRIAKVIKHMKAV